MELNNTAKDFSTRKFQANRLKVKAAESNHEVRDCLTLRYEIFANEMGANLAPGEIDRDRFDAACTHLMVYDVETDEVVATTRLLSSDDTHLVGGFYSETEFNIENILAQSGRIQIHPFRAY